MDGENSSHSDEEESKEDQEEEARGMCLPSRPDKFVSLNNRDLHRTDDECYRLILEAMHNKQWERAGSLLISYVQSLETQSHVQGNKAAEIIWRLGKEILLNHPKSRPEDVGVFYGTMKNIGVMNYLPISLEQVFYLLCEGQSEEAYRTLSIAESWRFGKVSIAQEKFQKLIQAYRAVLDYHSWMDKRSTMTEMDYSSQSHATQDISSYFRQATIAFQEILQYPGIWDPFVLCYVDLLESSGKEEEAEKVLTEYAYNNRNPANPNAHVYLYEFLKRNGASDEMLIKTLKILHSLVPSHKLMLNFSKLLRKSESEEHQQLALQVVFDLLDFSGWKHSVKAWSCLARQMKKNVKAGQSSWITEQWASRSDWWPSYHFGKIHVRKDWESCVDLAVKKASVSAMLRGQGCSYYSAVYQLSDEDQKIILDRVRILQDNLNSSCAEDISS